MTKIIYTTILLLALVSCDQRSRETKNLNTSAIETDQTSNKEPIISFDKKTWDFGTITDGEVVEHTFRFTNTGTSDLVISSASASCGCTIPNWPKEPILPGNSGEIEVIFKPSKGQAGSKQTKTVTVIGNTSPENTILKITAFVNKES